MSAWGTGLYQSDIANDVKSTYLGLLKKGKDNETALSETIDMFADAIADVDDAPLFWMALADQQWKLGRLQNEVKEQAISSIESELGSLLWYEQSAKLGKQREQVLAELKAQLESPQPIEKKIRIKQPYICSWEIGDVFAFPLSQPVTMQNGMEARYILFQVGGKFSFAENLIPVIRCWLSETTGMCEKPVFIKSQPVQRNDGSYIYAYKLLDTSERSVPKKLIFLGNHPVIMAEDDVNDIEYGNSGLVWKRFENTVINAFKTKVSGKIQINKDEAHERLVNLMKKTGLDRFIE